MMDLMAYKSEADANLNGEISFDAGECKLIDIKKDKDFDLKNITRKDVLDFGDEGFLLTNLLSENECQQVINNGEEIGFDSIRGQQENYRSSQRIIFVNDELCDILYGRLKPYLCDINIEGDPTKQHILGMTSLIQGVWKPVRLNNMFRLCRYYAGGHFGPHFDGHFAKSSGERSMQTLMLYLNGDFSGGSTNFINESQTVFKAEDGKFCAEEKNVLCRIKPETGLAIIFNHHRLHEGEKLENGKKYILRTDIMYENTSRAKLDPVEERAVLLVQEAERKEAVGECLDAAELYRKAFKLSPTVAAYYGF